MNQVDFGEIEGLLHKYVTENRNSLTQTEKDLCDELENKLLAVKEITKRIVELIDILCPDGYVRTEGDVDIFRFMGQELPLKRADPNIRIQTDNITMAYPVGGRVGFDKSDEKFQRELESLSIDFYQKTHRIAHIIRKLPLLNKVDFNTIANIRNHLIEHPEGKDSGVTFDSFAYSKNEGPFIKGARMNGNLKFMDEGFSNNVTEFISLFINAFKIKDSKEILRK